MVDSIYGYTMLMIKVEEGNLKEVKSVRKKHPNEDINVQNKAGQTALTLAARGGFLDIAEYLISQGANINTRNKSGQTPLFVACWYNHAELVELLLHFEADVNMSDSRGWTPIITACHNNNLEIVELLLKAEPDVRSFDCFGKRARERAKDSRIIKLISALERKQDLIEDPEFFAESPRDGRRRSMIRRNSKRSTSRKSTSKTPKRFTFGSPDRTSISREISCHRSPSRRRNSTASEGLSPLRTAPQFIHGLEYFKPYDTGKGKRGNSQKKSRSKKKMALSSSGSTRRLTRAQEDTSAPMSLNELQTSPRSQAGYDTTETLSIFRTPKGALKSNPRFSYANTGEKQYAPGKGEDDLHGSMRMSDLGRETHYTSNAGDSFMNTMRSFNRTREEVEGLMRKSKDLPFSMRSVGSLASTEGTEMKLGSRSSFRGKDILGSLDNLSFKADDEEDDMLDKELRNLFGLFIKNLYDKMHSALDKGVADEYEKEMERLGKISEDKFHEIIMAKGGEITDKTIRSFRNLLEDLMNRLNLGKDLSKTIEDGTEMLIKHMTEDAENEMYQHVMRGLETPNRKLSKFAWEKTRFDPTQSKRSSFESPKNSMDNFKKTAIDRLSEIFKNIDQSLSDKPRHERAQLSYLACQEILDGLDKIQSNVDNLLENGFSNSKFKTHPLNFDKSTQTNFGVDHQRATQTMETENDKEAGFGKTARSHSNKDPLSVLSIVFQPSPSNSTAAKTLNMNNWKSCKIPVKSHGSNRSIADSCHQDSKDESFSSLADSHDQDHKRRQRERLTNARDRLKVDLLKKEAESVSDKIDSANKMKVFKPVEENLEDVQKGQKSHRRELTFGSIAQNQNEEKPGKDHHGESGIIIKNKVPEQNRKEDSQKVDNRVPFASDESKNNGVEQREESHELPSVVAKKRNDPVNLSLEDNSSTKGERKLQEIEKSDNKQVAIDSAQAADKEEAKVDEQEIKESNNKQVIIDLIDNESVKQAEETQVPVVSDSDRKESLEIEKVSNKDNKETKIKEQIEEAQQENEKSNGENESSVKVELKQETQDKSSDNSDEKKEVSENVVQKVQKVEENEQTIVECPMNEEEFKQIEESQVPVVENESCDLEKAAENKNKEVEIKEQEEESPKEIEQVEPVSLKNDEEKEPSSEEAEIKSQEKEEKKSDLCDEKKEISEDIVEKVDKTEEDENKEVANKNQEEVLEKIESSNVPSEVVTQEAELEQNKEDKIENVEQELVSLKAEEAELVNLKDKAAHEVEEQEVPCVINNKEDKASEEREANQEENGNKNLNNSSEEKQNNNEKVKEDFVEVEEKKEINAVPSHDNKIQEQENIESHIKEEIRTTESNDNVTKEASSLVPVEQINANKEKEEDSILENCVDNEGVILEKASEQELLNSTNMNDNKIENNSQDKLNQEVKKENEHSNDEFNEVKVDQTNKIQSQAQEPEQATEEIIEQGEEEKEKLEDVPQSNEQEIIQDQPISDKLEEKVILEAQKNSNEQGETKENVQCETEADTVSQNKPEIKIVENAEPEKLHETQQIKQVEAESEEEQIADKVDEANEDNLVHDNVENNNSQITENRVSENVERQQIPETKVADDKEEVAHEQLPSEVKETVAEDLKSNEEEVEGHETKQIIPVSEDIEVQNLENLVQGNAEMEQKDQNQTLQQIPEKSDEDETKDKQVEKKDIDMDKEEKVEGETIEVRDSQNDEKINKVEISKPEEKVEVVPLKNEKVGENEVEKIDTQQKSTSEMVERSTVDQDAKIIKPEQPNIQSDAHVNREEKKSTVEGQKKINIPKEVKEQDYDDDEEIEEFNAEEMEINSPSKHLDTIEEEDPESYDPKEENTRKKRSSNVTNNVNVEEQKAIDTESIVDKEEDHYDAMEEFGRSEQGEVQELDNKAIICDSTVQVNDDSADKKGDTEVNDDLLELPVIGEEVEEKLHAVEKEGTGTQQQEEQKKEQGENSKMEEIVVEKKVEEAIEDQRVKTPIELKDEQSHQPVVCKTEEKIEEASINKELSIINKQTEEKTDDKVSQVEGESHQVSGESRKEDESNIVNKDIVQDTHQTIQVSQEGKKEKIESAEEQKSENKTIESKVDEKTEKVESVAIVEIQQQVEKKDNILSDRKDEGSINLKDDKVQKENVLEDKKQTKDVNQEVANKASVGSIDTTKSSIIDEKPSVPQGQVHKLTNAPVSNQKENENPNQGTASTSQNIKKNMYIQERPQEENKDDCKIQISFTSNIPSFQFDSFLRSNKRPSSPGSSRSSEEESDFDSIFKQFDSVMYRPNKINPVSSEKIAQPMTSKVDKPTKTTMRSRMVIQNVRLFTQNVRHMIPVPTPSRFVVSTKKPIIDNIPLSKNFDAPGQTPNFKGLAPRTVQKEYTETYTITKEWTL